MPIAATLADRVAQAVRDARATGHVEPPAELAALAATMSEALQRWRIVTEGSRDMLRNAGPAGAIYADV